MKLAFCLFHYFPFGGLQKDFLRIAKACLARNHTVDVYVMKWQGDYEPGLVIHLLPINAFTNHGRRSKFAKKLLPQLAAEQYDITVAFDKIPGVDFYYAADKCYAYKVLTQRSWLHRFLPRYFSSCRLEKKIFAKGISTEIFVLSQTQEDEYRQIYGTEKNRFHLLPPGIDKKYIAPSNAAEVRFHIRNNLGRHKDDYLVLMVGSGFKTKGLDRALRAFAQLSSEVLNKAYFYILGQDDKSKYLQLAQKLKIADHVFFLGGRDDVPQFMQAADVLIHPAYHENTGTVLLEATVAGLPVLTTDVCGYASYIKKAGSGIVLKSPFSQNKLNHALSLMLLSPEKSKWKAHGISFSQNADIYNMPKHVVHLIEDRYLRNVL